MSKINRAWHRDHSLPKNPSYLQRRAWHPWHARHCGCRGIDDGVAALFRKHGLPVPAPFGDPPAPANR